MRLERAAGRLDYGDTWALVVVALVMPRRT
jgi:hypothetical protein